MGRTSVKRRKKQTKLKVKKKASADLSCLSIDQLLSKAEELIDHFQYEEAQILCREALKRDPDSLKVLETSASLCLEVGNLDGAKHCLGRAITLQPDEGHKKYLSMAQLMDGKDSLQYYQKGIELMTEALLKLNSSDENGALSPAKEMALEEKDISANDEGIETSQKEVGVADGVASSSVSGNSCQEALLSNARTDGTVPSTSGLKTHSVGDEKTESEGDTIKSDLASARKEPDTLDQVAALKRELSLAYCSMSELFMTDLCGEETAESECCDCALQAIISDPTNPEAYLQMGSFHLVKGEVEEAKVKVKKSLALWLPKYKKLQDQSDGSAGEQSSLQTPVDTDEMPTYQYRLNAARTLIEIKEYEDANDVLEGLLEENDEVVDPWYLLGWSFYLQGSDFYDEARENLTKAQEICNVAPATEAMVEHIQQLLEELGRNSEESENMDVDVDTEQLEREIEELSSDEGDK